MVRWRKCLRSCVSSKPNHALAESKNASVVRKHMGYAHISLPYANSINTFNIFYQETFNP